VENDGLSCVLVGMDGTTTNHEMTDEVALADSFFCSIGRVEKLYDMMAAYKLRRWEEGYLLLGVALLGTDDATVLLVVQGVLWGSWFSRSLKVQ
jgi:hypothetical protein